MAGGAGGGVRNFAGLDGFSVQWEWVALAFGWNPDPGGECVDDGEDADGDCDDGDAVVGMNVERYRFCNHHCGDKISETGDGDEDAESDHGRFDGRPNEVRRERS